MGGAFGTTEESKLNQQVEEEMIEEIDTSQSEKTENKQLTTKERIAQMKQNLQAKREAIKKNVDEEIKT